MEKDRGFVVFLDFQGPLCGYQEHQDFYNLISFRKNKKSKFYKQNELMFKTQNCSLNKKIRDKFLCLTFPFVSADLIYRKTLKELKKLENSAFLASSSTCSVLNNFYFTEVVELLEDFYKNNIAIIKEVKKRKIKKNDILFLIENIWLEKPKNQKEIEKRFINFKKSNNYHYVFSKLAFSSLKSLFLKLKGEGRVKMSEGEFLMKCYYLSILRKESGLNFIGTISTVGDGNIRLMSSINWLKDNKTNKTPVFVDDLIVDSKKLIEDFKMSYKGIYLGGLRTKINIADILQS